MFCGRSGARERAEVSLCRCLGSAFWTKKTPFEKMTEEMVQWINEEKERKGLDLLILNGDLTHDNPKLLATLRDENIFRSSRFLITVVRGIMIL
jgi:hypothetical protein